MKSYRRLNQFLLIMVLLCLAFAPAASGSSFTKPSSGSVSDEAYSANWDAVTDEAASKNAIYDAISGLGGGHDAVTLNANATFLLSLSSQELGINTTRTDQWDTAYGWGDHSGEGYVTNLDSFDTDDLTEGVSNLYFPGFTDLETDYSFTDNSTNWDTAYSWGNHADEGYLTNLDGETDPVYSADPAAGITASHITNWDTAFGWGDHAVEGYITDLTSFNTDDLSEGDSNKYFPGFTDLLTDYGFTDNSTNWDTAYGWGDHSTQNYYDIDTHTAVNIAFSAAQNIEATDVSNALLELDLEKALVGHDHSGTYQPANANLTELTDRSSTLDWTFGSVAVNTEAYDATNWDADLTVPTKDAVRDKIESINDHASVTLNAGAEFLLTLSTQELGVNTTRTDLWDTAYSWGNHAAQNYLDKDTDSYVETESDPNALLTADTDNVQNSHINWDDLSFLEDNGAITADSVNNAAINWSNFLYLDDNGRTATDSVQSAGINWDDTNASDVPFTPAQNIAAVDVNAAILELDLEKALVVHNHDGTYEPAGVNAEEVSFAAGGNIVATDVQAAIEELDDEKDEIITAGRSLTRTTNTIAVDSELFQHRCGAAISSPNTDDTELVQWSFTNDITVTFVGCSTDTGTMTIQLDERVFTTPNTAGTNILTSTLECNTDGPSTTSFDNASIVGTNIVNLLITATNSTPAQGRIHVGYNIDD